MYVHNTRCVLLTVDMKCMQPFINVCHGKPPAEPLGDAVFPNLKTDMKVLVEVIKCNEELLSCLYTHPCAAMPRHVDNISDVSIDTISSLCGLGLVRSLHCIISDLKSVLRCNELLTVLQKNSTTLDEVVIVYSAADDLMPNKMPVLVSCQRLKFVVSQFTSVFKWAYNPDKKLLSFHIKCVESAADHKLEFTKDISDIVIYNSNSLLDLSLSGVTVSKENCLLRETLAHCHSLVVLELSNTHNGSFSSAKAHNLFSSLEILLKLEFLIVSNSINVFGEDMYALYNLLVQYLPKLKYCHLSFHRFVVFLSLLEDKKYEPIQELLLTLLSNKKPTADCHTVAFRWRNNQNLQVWLCRLRYDVEFKL